MDCSTPGFPVLPMGTLTKEASSSWTFLLPIFRENFKIFGFFLITGRKHTQCISEDNKFCPYFWPWGNHCWSLGVYPSNLSGQDFGSDRPGTCPSLTTHYMLGKFGEVSSLFWASISFCINGIIIVPVSFNCREVQMPRSWSMSALVTYINVIGSFSNPY